MICRTYGICCAKQKAKPLSACNRAPAQRTIVEEATWTRYRTFRASDRFWTVGRQPFPNQIPVLSEMPVIRREWRDFVWPILHNDARTGSA